MAAANHVRQTVNASFPEPDRANILARLERYTGPEKARVRLAIVVLADGDAVRLANLVRAANADYRNILFVAEYPEESGTGTRQEMAARFRRLGVPVPEGLG